MDHKYKSALHAFINWGARFYSSFSIREKLTFLFSSVQLRYIYLSRGEDGFEENTKNLNCNGNHARKVASLSTLSYRGIRVSRYFGPALASSYLPYLLFLPILCYLSPSFSRPSSRFPPSLYLFSCVLRILDRPSIRLGEMDIHNVFAVVRWRGVPRRFSFLLLSPSIARPAKNIRAIIPRRRCLALGCL